MDGPSGPCRNLPWLEPLLASCGLLHECDRARAWCEAMGAIDAAEVMASWQDLVDHLQLEATDRRCLQEVCEGEGGEVARTGAEQWLLPWLESHLLGHYAEEALRWSRQMSASSLDEVMEFWEVFAADLQMDCLEIHRLAAASGAAPASKVRDLPDSGDRPHRHFSAASAPR